MTASLIIGDRNDSHVEAVVAVLEALGVEPPLMVDAPKLTTTPYTVTADHLTVDGITIETNNQGRGWLRRYAPTLWGAGTVAGGLESARKRAFLSLVGSLSRTGNRQWLTTLESMLAAEDRLHQLHVVAGRGHRTPRTAVTSELADARRILGDAFVVKPLANGYYNTEDGPRAVFTAQLKPDDFDHVDFADAPFVVQEMIATVEHLRVVTVKDRAWAASLNADGRPLDWREQDEAHSEWQPVHAPDVCAAALDVAAHLRVGYTSQDWVRDRADHPVFLDLNPGGQWLFLPDEVSAPVTDAIAMHLAGGDQ